MIVRIAMALSLVFLKLRPWGITLTVAVWVGGLALAARTYHAGMKRTRRFPGRGLAEAIT